MHKGVLESIAYARSLRPDRLMAVSVVSNAEEQERITKAWRDFDIPVELRTVYSPFRELQRPIVKFVDELDAEIADDFVTVILPSSCSTTGGNRCCTAERVLRARLRARPNTIVTSVPFHLHGGEVEVVGPTD